MAGGRGQQRGHRRGPAGRRRARPLSTLDLDPRVRCRRGLLVGGVPVRALRLNPAAARIVDRWRSGDRSVHDRELSLARRLHDAGLAVLRSPGPHTVADVTVVVPARDRADALARCVASIGACARVLVVDDGSRDPLALQAVCAPHGAEVVRRAHGGPAAARNTGLAQVTTPLVAFVDSDCVLPPGWLEGLLPGLLEGVAVVAPRVVGAGGPGLLARFETAAGPLDLGTHAGPVAPGARVGHVPAAVLLGRTASLAAGFDERLRVGEDVDLVWRLAGRGLAVRYEPSVAVRHETRESLAAWLLQRVGYGRSAALLDARHPGHVAPLVMSRWMLAGLALRRPSWVLAGTAVSAARLRRQLPAPEAGRLAMEGLGWTLLALADALARPWLPALLPLSMVSPAARRVAVAAVTTRLARRRRTRGDLGVLAWAGLQILDDLAYGAGVWAGAVRHRRPAVLLPRVR